jgi:hypothetical protein
MLTYLLMTVFFVGAGIARGQLSAQGASHPGVAQDTSAFALWDQTADSTTDTQSSYLSNLTAGHESPSWLFPITKLNEHLPSWIRIGGQYRNRLEGPTGIGFTGTNDFYLLDRLRVRVAIQPRPWLSFLGEVQDSRIFFNHHIPNGNPYEDSWTLWDAYPQIGSSTEGWVDALAGRQTLSFGDERVIGPSNWLNVGRTFNVARVDFHHTDYKVSVFASSVVPGDSLDLHKALPGNNLYGIYGSFLHIVPKAKFEPCVLWRVAPANPGLSEEVGHGHLNEITLGLHWKGTLPSGFDYDSEFDGQQGSLGQYSISAWAGYAGLGKTYRNAHSSVRTFLELNYASGTKNPGGHEWNTFDQLYPSNHDKYGFDDLIGRRNLVQYRAGIEEVPAKKWRLKQQFEGFWLATVDDNLYNSSGAIAVNADPGASRHVSNELDIVAEYTLDKGLNFGFGYGRMFVGPFLRTTTAGHDYQYPYAYFQYNFTMSAFHFPISTNQPNYW